MIYIVNMVTMVPVVNNNKIELDFIGWKPTN